MIVGLHDSEKEHFKHKTFPNYALMKISAYHKAKGDTVEWWNPAKSYDLVYSSKIFDFTEENKDLPPDTIKGGTGYDIEKQLPQEIEDMYPDYSIYPDCNYAIGYITRGCPNKCPWCYVPRKEGNIRPYRLWTQLVRIDTPDLVLMDNNILASEYGIAQLKDMIGKGWRIDLNQGMDARLVTEEIADILAGLQWIKYIRFSCDTVSQVKHIDRVAEMLERRGIKPYRLFIYVLVRKDLDEADYRVQQLKKHKGIHLYAQAERNEGLGIRPNKAQLEFTNRYIYGNLYRKETWKEYLSKRPWVRQRLEVAENERNEADTAKYLGNGL